MNKTVSQARRIASMGLVALTLGSAAASLSGSTAEAGNRFVIRREFGGFHANFARDAFHPRSFGRGFGGGFRGGFGGGFGGGLGGGFDAASLAFGMLGAVMATADAAQQAQPQCYLVQQPVVYPDGRYYYRRVTVCR